MESQHILDDPLAAAAAIGRSLSQQETETLTLLQESRSQCAAQLKQLNEQKGINSRLIGEAKKNGDDAKGLISRMREISAAVKTAKLELKRLEEEIAECFSSPVDESDVSTDNAADDNSRLQIRHPCDNSQQPAEYKICELGENTAEWDAFVQSSSAASIYHLTRWRELIKDCFGHDCHYLQALDANNSVVGVLPLVRLKSRLFGDYLVSVPYFNYGGAVALSAEIEVALMQSAEQLAQDIGVSHIEFRDTAERQCWPKRTDKVAMLLPLPASVEQLGKQIGSKLRAQIKRAERENPEILQGGVELLDDFYTVFALNMRDLGTPVYGKEFFRKILQGFPDESRLIVLRHAGKPVSTAFLLTFKQGVEIPWASTLREVNKLSMNMLLYWEVLQYAIQRQADCFDFGRSSRDAGTYKFKKQWGAQELPLYWHYWLNDGGELPQLNPNNPKYQLAIKVWRRLPVALTKLIGPRIVKNLP